MNGTRPTPLDDAYFSIVPNWLIEHPDVTAPMLRQYSFMRKNINYYRTKGWALIQVEMATEMGLSAGSVNKTMQALERTHRGHRHGEPCADDGTCVQAVVKEPGKWKGRNGWSTYWLDSTKAQVAELGQKLHSSPLGISPETADAAPEPVDNPPTHSQKRPVSTVKNDRAEEELLP